MPYNLWNTVYSCGKYSTKMHQTPRSILILVVLAHHQILKHIRNKTIVFLQEIEQLWARRQYKVKHFQILIQPLIKILRKELYHLGAMVEGIVITHSIGELDIDGGISCLHQFKVMMRRPVLPLPSMKGWMVSNAICRSASFSTILRSSVAYCCIRSFIFGSIR